MTRFSVVGLVCFQSLAVLRLHAAPIASCVEQTTKVSTAKADRVDKCGSAKTSTADKSIQQARSRECQTATAAADAADKNLQACRLVTPALKPATEAYTAQVNALQQEMAKQKDSDFELELGIGSLIRNGEVTDYSDNANTLSASSLGSATPQYLLGVAMRSELPNFNGRLGPPRGSCDAADALAQGQANDNTEEFKATRKALADQCPAWRRKPWAGFLSLKFSPNSTQTLNGYVLGGSYRAMRYMNFLVGFSLTPVNVPSPGLRNAAYQYVTAQQKLGLLLNYNPAAMQKNATNAFDGFSIANPTGKLIYSGTPLEVDYRGGVVVGVSLPINFADFLKGK